MSTAPNTLKPEKGIFVMAIKAGNETKKKTSFAGKHKVEMYLGGISPVEDGFDDLLGWWKYFPPVQVIYFYLRGTLIDPGQRDKELGVFEALKPLLKRNEVKKREPRAPYVRILSDTYVDVALRLGLDCTPSEPWLFAQSFFRWPLIPHARTWTIAFTAIALYFHTLFTWDACAAYKPDLAVFERPLSYYDVLGVSRQRTCLVSGSLHTDLEPAKELGIPRTLLWIMSNGKRACPVALKSLANLVNILARMRSHRDGPIYTHS
ncbi:hypothetical protein K438DRAFT_1974913 [Mycena galopus ATCC 62051]|nr:hypothetical protein K438DRAFT_1974913 [Mycena galopus ATCC 62051]